jgi:hypothetical protein
MNENSVASVDNDLRGFTYETSATLPAQGIPAASQPVREELFQIAVRLSEAKNVAADMSNPLIGSSGEVIDPAVRDAYVCFQNLFADEADIVTGATLNSELTQPQADEAAGLGRRLIALLDSPPPH